MVTEPEMAEPANKAVKNPINGPLPSQVVPQDELQPDGVRAQQPEGDMPGKETVLPPGTPISLALSGGGFRATLFHLGAFWFLHQGRRLKDVKWICSVSGGSILAAHVVLKWADYASGDSARFKNAAEELLSFVRLDVRGRIIRGQFLLFLLYLAGIPFIAYLYSVDALAYLPLFGNYPRIPIASLHKPWLYTAVLLGLFAGALFAFLVLFSFADWITKFIVGQFKKPWLRRPLLPDFLFLPLVVLGLPFVLHGRTLIMSALFLLILWQLLRADSGLFRSLPWARPTWLLRRHYDNYLFAGAAMNSLSPSDEGRPELHLLATNMTTGKLCSFSASGYIDDVVENYENRAQSAETLEGGTLPVSTAVAASSAFPPVFPPVLLRKRRDLKTLIIATV